MTATGPKVWKRGKERGGGAGKRGPWGGGGGVNELYVADSYPNYEYHPSRSTTGTSFDTKWIVDTT